MPRQSGRELNEKWGIGVRHALYRESGDWYHVPKNFPAALIDAYGYVRFETERDLEIDGIMRSRKEGKDWLSVRKPGISSLERYKRMDMSASLESSSEAANHVEWVSLREYDPAERLATQESCSVLYRNLHRTITNAICKGFAAMKPRQGVRLRNEYDVLLVNYDRLGRDLLIEVKPDPDRGSIRIAIGQLYDYRRFLQNATATDLAILTIGKPNKSYMDLLLTLGITSLWFHEEKCRKLRGVGVAWEVLRLNPAAGLLL